MEKAASCRVTVAAARRTILSLAVTAAVVAGCGTSPSPSPRAVPSGHAAATGSPSPQSTAPSPTARAAPTAAATAPPSTAPPSTAPPSTAPPAPAPPSILPTAAVPAAALYASTSPASPGPPGSIIRVEPIRAQSGARAWAVLYRSTGIDGTTVAVSGIVVAPDSPAPPGGRPVLAWAHGTVGLADACAPSHTGDAGELAYLAGPFLERGFVVVATDYEGLGTAGIHPYLVGESEGRSVLDIARAASGIHTAGAGRDVVLLGHSQGGHAVLWAAQLAATYAPDLRIVTTVAVAPAAELVSIAAWIAGPTSPAVARLNGLLVAAAWHDVYGLPLQPGLTGAGATIARRLPNACPDLALLPAGQPFEPNAVSLPQFNDLLRANTPGAARAEGPILLLQGTADEQIPAATNEAAARSLCAAGDEVQLDILPGVDHSGALVNEGNTIGSWILSRMAGVPVSASCRS